MKVGARCVRATVDDYEALMDARHVRCGTYLTAAMNAKTCCPNFNLRWVLPWQTHYYYYAAMSDGCLSTPTPCLPRYHPSLCQVGRRSIRAQQSAAEDPTPHGAVPVGNPPHPQGPVQAAVGRAAGVRRRLPRTCLYHLVLVAPPDMGVIFVAQRCSGLQSCQMWGRHRGSCIRCCRCRQWRWQWRWQWR